MKTQKRLAGRILKSGIRRIWIDPDVRDEVAGAMTAGDIRKFIGLGFIKAKSVKGNSRGRWRAVQKQKKKGRRDGLGKRKGGANARLASKTIWIRRIRAQRSILKKLRDEKKITTTLYRKTYRLAKGGEFKSRAYVLSYLKEAQKKQ